MFEEPIRYFVDCRAAKSLRSRPSLMENDTFVNRPPGPGHYGMPETAEGGQTHGFHVENCASATVVAGCLPMAVFFSPANAPGLRTSPVKRGYWGPCARLLGETDSSPRRLPVPELPKDEAEAGRVGRLPPRLLAPTQPAPTRIARACHRRFDAIGLVFEDFGPVGERPREGPGEDIRSRPLRPSPDGKDHKGLQGLRAYLRDKATGRFC